MGSSGQNQAKRESPALLSCLTRQMPPGCLLELIRTHLERMEASSLNGYILFFFHLFFFSQENKVAHKNGQIKSVLDQRNVVSLKTEK